MRPIDADRLLEFIERYFGQTVGGIAVRQIVEEQPTLTQPNSPVRCKDCIHDGMIECPLCYIEHHTLTFVNHDPDFFCGKAERKPLEGENRT